jgi:hypothetical protein
LGICPGSEVVEVVVACLDCRRRQDILATRATIQLDANRLGSSTEVIAVNLYSVVPSRDVNQMASRVEPVDAVRASLVGDGSVGQLPAVDGRTIEPILENNPITTERGCNTGVAITFPTSTPSEKKESGEEPIEFHVTSF